MAGIVISGPPLAENAADEQFVHVQLSPAAVTLVTHNLGRRPGAVSLFSPDYGTEYWAYTVQHMDVNSLRISMDTPTPFAALIG